MNTCEKCEKPATCTVVVDFDATKPDDKFKGYQPIAAHYLCKDHEPTGRCFVHVSKWELETV
jgi:hypothetical protein